MGKLIAMHIDRDLARDVVRELFGEEDEEALLDAAIDRRLRGKAERLGDPRGTSEADRLSRSSGVRRVRGVRRHSEQIEALAGC